MRDIGKQGGPSYIKAFFRWKHSYFGSFLIDGENEHEHEEEASAAEEVPDVVSDVKSGRLSTERMGFQKPTHPS